MTQFLHSKKGEENFTVLRINICIYVVCMTAEILLLFSETIWLSTIQKPQILFPKFKGTFLKLKSHFAPGKIASINFDTNSFLRFLEVSTVKDF